MYLFLQNALTVTILKLLCMFLACKGNVCIGQMVSSVGMKVMSVELTDVSSEHSECSINIGWIKGRKTEVSLWNNIAWLSKTSLFSEMRQGDYWVAANVSNPKYLINSCSIFFHSIFCFLYEWPHFSLLSLWEVDRAAQLLTVLRYRACLNCQLKAQFGM